MRKSRQADLTPCFPQKRMDFKANQAPGLRLQPQLDQAADGLGDRAEQVSNRELRNTWRSEVIHWRVTAVSQYRYEAGSTWG